MKDLVFILGVLAFVMIIPTIGWFPAGWRPREIESAIQGAN